MGQLWGKVWPLLLAIFLFGIIIAIHEFGHFVFAKLFGVKVNEFALGMGPTVLKRQKGETKYALRLFPVGGFVSMEGEDENSEDERAFNKKKVWKRFVIVAAGAIQNIILGIIVVSVLLTMQELVGTNKIHSFYPDSVSSEYGLEPLDEIVKINGMRIYSDRDISYIMVTDEDSVLDFTVRRDDKLVQVDGVHFKTTEYEGRQIIIWDFSMVGVEKSFSSVASGAIRESASIVRMVRLSLVDLVRGKYGLKDVSGPIGTIGLIAETTADGETAKDKIETALTLLSFITINVGVFNLMPIPALDGGRLFFLIIEGIRRKPINPKYEGYVHTAGLVALLAFMAVVTVSDILKFV
ncbi:MAG: site-2 protease family protein [Clostridiales bacterium]|nr:site-2 protease family protein [Clostridiales bacterium]